MEQDAVAVPQQAFDWRVALRKHRRERRMTLQEAAQRSGLSLATVKAYEHGTRKPGERSLRALIDALGLPREDGNRILGGAGYAVDWYALFHERFAVPDSAAVQQELDALPWPAFIANQSFDVLKWNDAFERVLGVDIDARGDGFLARNLLGSITDESFARRMLNWDEVVSFMIGLAKGDPRATNEPEDPASWLRPAVSRLLGGSPARVTRLMELWQTAPPVRHALRHRYRVVWDAGTGPMTFIASFVPADLWDELHWNEWTPADADTWKRLDRLQSRDT